MNATWNVTLTNESNVESITYNISFKGKREKKSSAIRVDRDFENFVQEVTSFTNDGEENYSVNVTAKNKCGETIPNATNMTMCVVDSSSTRLCCSALSTVAVLCVAIMTIMV